MTTPNGGAHAAFFCARTEEPMNDRFMREHPILPLLLSMAIPNMVSMLVSALYNIVDSFFVARISEQAFP